MSATTENINKKMATLPIVETFYSIQGEGFHSGCAAFFIRTAGCDVGCVWCDTKNSWEVNDHPLQTIDSLVNEVSEAGSPIAIITGGEPSMHNLEALTSALHEADIETHIETAGVNEIKGNFDWICVSPKKFKAPLDEVLAIANELKIVIFNAHDLEWATTFINKVPENCLLYLQPEWSMAQKMQPLIIEFIKKNPEWQLSLQTHKHLSIQ